MTRIALALAVLAFVHVLLMFAPTPSWTFWLVHMAALESSLVATLVASLALLLARRGVRAGERRARVARGLAAISAVVGLLPFATTAPLWLGAEPPLSLADYVRGLPASPARVTRNVDVGASGLLVDFYRLPTAGARPLLVSVHGGSFRHGDKGEAPALDLALAAAGYVVADVQYRLAPAHPFPDAIADVKCLVGRLRERAGEFGIDPSRVTLFGRSAGGEIALIAAYAMGDARIPPSCAVAEAPVQGVISLYAPTDLAWGHDHPAFPDPIDGPRAIEEYLGGPPAARPDAYRLASPTTWADRALPPTLLIHGLVDRVVKAEHARFLAAALLARHRSVTTLLIPMADHGLDCRSGGIGEQLARAAILRFLEGTSVPLAGRPTPQGSLPASPSTR